MYLFFIAFCLITKFSYCLGNEELRSGPFNYTVTSVKACDDTGTNEIQYHLNTQRLPQRYGERQQQFCFPGHIVFQRNLDNNLKIHISVAILRNGTHKQNFMEFHLNDACSDLNNLEPNWSKMVRAMGVKGINNCPILKGTYNVDCSNSPKVEPKMIREIPHGTYLTFLKYLDKQDNLIGCVKFTTIVSSAEKQSTVY